MTKCELYKRSQQGFSLVELMVTSTIGLLLLAAVSGLFLSSNYSAKETATRSGIYENGRYALSTLNDELRAAGFWGGTHAIDIAQSGGLDPIVVDCSDAAAGYNYNESLWALTPTTANVLGCITNAVVGSDVLVVKHVAQTPTVVADILPARTYLMSNTTKGILFDGADPAPSTGDGGNVPSGQAWEYINSIYYVANNDDGIPTLYRKRLYGNVWGSLEEVALGVERLHVQFGVDTSGDGVADSFRDGANAEWDSVVSAHVYLLVRSENENPSYEDNKTYKMGDVTVSPIGDHYHRLVFDTSVNLRNLNLMVSGGF